MAVAWIQGRNTAPLESLPTLPFQITRLDYLGDLDAAGLEIAATACGIANRLGIPAGPAAALWTLLVEQPARPGVKVEPQRAGELTNWLPDRARERAFSLLTDGEAVPQEALRFDLLDRALSAEKSRDSQF
ncbi:hypothetical protein [Amycolatopsis roodepoortensis]|uniref:hypothetical protein n=1 Tax=Amycolatopsis roodepoortensis TaxID=700274 RepID=UPI003FCEA829